MIRCMLSVGSGSKTFGALKVTIYVKFFELSVHKMSTFLRISACQWTMPSGLFAKKGHTKFFCSCYLALVSKLENDPLISPSGKKITPKVV